MSAILPGATIGILGGGQLGRMTAMAARSLGYRVQVMDPDPSCPARFVVDACFEGSWDDAKAAADLARGCDVVTLEIEQLALDTLRAAQRYAPVRPGEALLAIIQDRIAQKEWLAARQFPVGPFRSIRSLDNMRAALDAFGRDCFVKSARGGYDGRSQLRITPRGGESAELAWRALGQRPCIAEQAIALEREISVLVARTPSGALKSFPSATNHHENQILAWSVIPSSIPPAMEAEAQRIACSLAEKLGLEGILAVEMFVTQQGALLINELAPRPHNSYHASERSCVVSQFEQHVRAVCDLPLGSTDVLRPAAIANLLGDAWADGQPHFDRALEVESVRLHLYEKHTARPGRKMGHLSAVGDTPEEAVQRVLEAKSRL
ncbi:MAG TPA: 5-(carboxyamino)imidazole ribonucleotide synthase [Acidobacteriaceae bacterium]